MTRDDNNQKILIYGGNGFVGCRVAEILTKAGAEVICASRSGHRPAHLRSSDWADQVEWIKANAAYPDLTHLENCGTLICLVGSPPIPTLRRTKYDEQVFTNGIANCRAIEAAANTSIRRIILLGAKIPSFLDREWFGYAAGKRLAAQCAEEFSNTGKDHQAVLIQPGAIFGVRHTAGGTAIPIDILMRPLSKLFSSQLISVERVAKRIANEALVGAVGGESFKIIVHGEI